MLSSDVFLPEGACDGHMHAFGLSDSFPPAAGALYPAPEGTSLQDYVALARSVGITRQVLVQPSYYRVDNSYLLHALRAVGSQATRGIVMLEERPVERSALLEMDTCGVRGIRLDLVRARRDGLSQDSIVAMMENAAVAAASVGWSIDLYAPGPVAFALAHRLPDLPVPCTIAHMGYLKSSDGISDADCHAFIRTISRGNVWVKLTGAYRYDNAQRADRLARILLQAMPDRLIWGTDWPHVMAPPQDTLQTIRWLQEITQGGPDYRAILVDNPARLYNFPRQQ